MGVRPLVSIQRLAELDRRWTLALSRRVASHSCLRVASVLLARSGDGLVWIAVWAMLLALDPVSDRESLYRAMAAVPVTALVVTLLKFGVRRQRPLGAASARWSALPKHDIYSFPSGPAARSVCMATTLLLGSPTLGQLFAVWAVGICVARIGLAAHYMLDVVAGAAIGVSVAVSVTGAWPRVTAFLEALRL